MCVYRSVALLFSFLLLVVLSIVCVSVLSVASIVFCYSGAWFFCTPCVHHYYICALHYFQCCHCCCGHTTTIFRVLFFFFVFISSVRHFCDANCFCVRMHMLPLSLLLLLLVLFLSEKQRFVPLFELSETLCLPKSYGLSIYRSHAVVTKVNCILCTLCFSSSLSICSV